MHESKVCGALNITQKSMKLKPTLIVWYQDFFSYFEQSTREAEIKLKTESRVKLFALDPDAQVRLLTRKQGYFMLILSRWKQTYINFSFLFLKKLDFSSIEPEVKPFEEKFGKKILVKCNDLSFNLQSCVAENEEGPTTNVNN